MTVGKHEATVVVKGESSGASKALDQVAKSSEKLEKKLARATGKANSLAKSLGNKSAYSSADASFQQLTQSVAVLKAGLAGAAIAGAAKLAAKTWELAKAQNQLDGIYRNLNFSVDAAAFATNNLISKSELARSAAAAQALGVATNAEEFATLASSVQLAASAQGVDFAHALNQVTQGIGKQSAARLDDLGIIVKAGDAQRKYAQELGVTVTQLTAEQKQAAFAKEALRQLGDMAGNAAPIQENLTVALQQTGTAVTDLFEQFAGGGETGGSAETFFRQLGIGAKDASKDFENMQEALEKGTENQKKMVREFMEFKKLSSEAVSDAEKLELLNLKLWGLGKKSIETQQEAGFLSRAVLGLAEDTFSIQQRATSEAREQTRLADEKAVDLENSVNFAESSNAASVHAVNLARAQGVKEKDILILQQEQIRAQFAIVEAKLLTGDVSDDNYEIERDKAIKQLQVLEALINKTQARGRAGKKASKDIVKGLIEEARMGEDAIASREASADLAMLFHEQETAGMDGTLAQREALQLQRERELDFIIGDDLPAMQERINKENEILQLQIEAAALSEEMAFTAADREEAAGAREQLLHEQKVKRLVDEKQLKEEMAAQLDRDRQKQLDNSVAVLGIQKNFMAGFGKIAIEGAKHRGASEKAVFNAEKAIKSASLSLDAITYGAKAAAAFAAGQFISGAGNTVAAGIAAASAIQTLALTPDSARGAAGASGGAAAATTPDRGGDAPPSSAVPASAAEGRGATLPNGAGPSAGGGVSVTIGTFTTLGTVDDETGTKLAHAIERVKADGLT